MGPDEQGRVGGPPFAGVLGATVGALVGTATFPVLFVGIVVGVGIGEFLGILSKFAVGLVIWLTIAIAAFWP